MTKAADFDLDPDEIISAAVEILEESGLDAVSMRSVSSRLGVSPVPVYSRIGNKEALVDALADRLLSDLAPEPKRNETWDAYAKRWARELRSRLAQIRDSRLILAGHRAAYVQASRPLIEIMRRDGLAADAAMQACRLLMWTTVGFGAVEMGAQPSQRRRRGRPGSDPTGVSPAEIDALFDLQIRYVIAGIAADMKELPATKKGVSQARAKKSPSPQR